MTGETGAGPPVKALPEIPEEVTEDVPEALDKTGVSARLSGVSKKAGNDPVGEQRRRLELVRHYFAMGLAVLCLVLLVLMSGVTYVWPRGDLTVIRETADVLKILATASLGYLFGQAVGRS